VDPRALKCVFVGYLRKKAINASVYQKENESYYGEKPDMTDVFPDFSTNDNLDTCRVEDGDKIQG
jgi:hypothetical protein